MRLREKGTINLIYCLCGRMMWHASMGYLTLLVYGRVYSFTPSKSFWNKENVIFKRVLLIFSENHIILERNQVFKNILCILFKERLKFSSWKIETHTTFQNRVTFFNQEPFQEWFKKIQNDCTVTQCILIQCSLSRN